MEDLDDILEGEGQPVEAVEAPQPEEAPQEQPRDENGQFAAKGEESAPPAQEEDRSKGLEAGIAAERRKRQEAEERYQTLEAEIAALKAKPAEPPAPAPDMWEDTPGWQNHFGQEVASVAVQQATMNARLDMSEMMVRQSNEDFDELKPQILQFMRENPAVQQQVLSDPHPWQKAYRMVKNQQAMTELGATDLESLKAQLTEQIKAEMAQQAPAAPNLPQSLADAQSSKQGGAPMTNNLSLDDILNG